ncbi:sensor histidine kinase [Maritalea mobilis]|uniref:sensor histidine kinase n=1 Tax=Maritalea mobilis TaxID=483324 RepID=UPI001C94EE36|nr:sensor histidine kinase [Maritalea mobilis]MBY6200188.1 sensor histidine kinase [Maritalea mobilis]
MNAANMRRTRRFRSLRTRLVVVLSLAILPLGLLAVQQTRAVISDARELEEQDILLRTGSAAGAEQALLRRAYGAAHALGLAAMELTEDDAACDALMRRFVDSSAAFSFAGVANADGLLSCTSGGSMDISDATGWLDMVERPEPRVSVNREGPFSGQSVMVVTMPIIDPETDDFQGAAYVSLPHSLTDTLLQAGVDGVILALIDNEGNVLSASTGIDDVGVFEDLNVRPMEYGPANDGTTFTIELEDGTERLAALVPLIADRIYVLGLWTSARAEYSVPLFGEAAATVPILIWVVALVVAVMAIDRMVLRHLTELRRRMAGFSIDDPSDSFAILDRPPAEIGQIAGTYNRMVDRLLADRAEMEENLREKELLLREVHHRVKNNLQLIASILNMQLRSVPDGIAHKVLRRVQARVMSLATIHKALYTGTQMSTVRADRLLQEVVQAAFNVGVPSGQQIKTSFTSDDIQLVPDQAVPLALLANEMVTNATKYLGRPASGRPEIEVRMYRTEGFQVHLVVENTVGEPVQEVEGSDGTGLGARLIEGFVAQLGGEMDLTETEERYRVEISFIKFRPDQEDGTADADDTDPDPATEREDSAA